MTFKTSAATLAIGLLWAGSQASADTINFDNLAEGAVVSNQYAALGAIFSANAFSGAGSSSSEMDWATNTDMTVTAVDIGGLGTPAWVGGNLLHAFGTVSNNAGWLSENGDPSFKITFTTPINFISAAFAGVSDAAPAHAADVRLFAYNGATLLGTVAGSASGQFTLSFSAASITSVAIAAGSFDDWVGVDNINFAPVPEPGTYGLMALGLAVVGVVRLRAARRPV